MIRFLDNVHYTAFIRINKNINQSSKQKRLFTSNTNTWMYKVTLLTLQPIPPEDLATLLTSRTKHRL